MRDVKRPYLVERSPRETPERLEWSLVARHGRYELAHREASWQKAQLGNHVFFWRIRHATEGVLKEFG